MADPNALYYFSGGGNDLTNAQKMSSSAAAQSYVISEADSMAADIEQLKSAGAQYFVLDNFNGENSNSLSVVYNDEPWSDLTSAGIQFTVADDSRLVRRMSTNPQSFGITKPPVGPFNSNNPYSPSNGGSVVNPSPSILSQAWSLFGTQDVSPNAPATYLWADDQHLAEAGQSAEANYTVNAIQHAAPVVSETLNATVTDPFTSNTTTDTTFQWQRLLSGQTNWTDISGATSSSYTVQIQDAGAQLRVEAFYSDSSGNTANAISPASYAVAVPTLFGAITHDPNSAGGQIYAIYDGLLGHAPDQLGFENWTAALQANLNGQGGLWAQLIVRDFLGSPEFTQRFGSYTQISDHDFVEDLYQTALHRPGDPQGEAGWENALANGVTREDVAYDFVFSAEHEQDLSGAFSGGVFVPNATDDTIARLYYATLNRVPDAAGLQAWENGAANGLSLNTIAQDFVASPERQASYGSQTDQQFVDALYQAALGRTPDPAGEQGWVNGLGQGMSRGTVALAFAQSTEAEQHLAPQIEYGFKVT